MAREIFEQAGEEFLPAGAPLKRLDNLGPTVVRGGVQDRIDAMPGYQKAYIVAGGALATSAMECTDDQKSAAVIAGVFTLVFGGMGALARSQEKKNEKTPLVVSQLERKLKKAKSKDQAVKILAKNRKGVHFDVLLQNAARILSDPEKGIEVTPDDIMQEFKARGMKRKFGNRRSVIHTGYAPRSPEDTRRNKDQTRRLVADLLRGNPEFQQALEDSFFDHLEDPVQDEE